MGLSSDLISQFVKATKPEPAPKQEATVYGTIVDADGTKSVRLDGSELLTPVSSTVNIKDGDRVTVLIKNHQAIVTGNMSAPSANNDDINGVYSKINQFEIVVAGKVSTEQLEAEKARINELVAEDVRIKGDLEATNATIGNLTAKDVEIEKSLTATKASIETLDSKYAEITNADIENLNALDIYVRNLEGDYATFKELTTDTFEADEARIKELETDRITASEVESTYATIRNLEVVDGKFDTLESEFGEFDTLVTDYIAANDANIKDLQTDRITATQVAAQYANIDFANITEAAVEKIFSESGIIDDLIVSEGRITGKLVGVTIVGDLIEGGTVKADKLVVQGEDGLFYKLNVSGEGVETEQTEYNSLNGSIITAQSITAEKIAVDDLVAFDATIGGFHISNSAIYSGAKASVDNTTRGIYLDKDAQVNIGDTNSFIKYYKDQNGDYKLEISAESLLIGSSKKSVELAINETQDRIDNIQIGGRNLATISRIENNLVSPESCTREGFVYHIDKQTRFNSIYFNPTNLVIGETYILSFKFQKTGGTLVCIGGHSEAYSQIAYYIDGQKTTYNYSSRAMLDDTTDIHTVEFIFTYIGNDTGSGNKFLYIQPNRDGIEPITCDIWDIQVEKGNTRATDWSPAPEDLAYSEDLITIIADATSAQAAADKAQADANKAQADADAALADLETAQQNLEAVKNRVDATEEDIAEAQQKVDAAQNTADTAVTNAANAKAAADAAQQTANEAQDAADRAQAAADALGIRVTSAETNISKNAEAIELQATKVTEVDNKFANYYTREETDAAIKVEADAITSTVSNLKTEVDNIQITNRNLATVDDCIVVLNDGEFCQRNGFTWHFTRSTLYSGLAIREWIFEVGETYTISYKLQKTAGTLANIGGHSGGFNQIAVYINGEKINGSYSSTIAVEDTTDVYSVTFIGTYKGGTTENRLYIQPNRVGGAAIEYDLWDVIVTKGGRIVDWTPAPEDTSSVEYTNSQIKQTSDAITTQVTKVQSDVDNLEIGGRNLILDTSIPTTVTGTSDYAYVTFIPTVGLTIGETYIVSANVEIIEGTCEGISACFYDVNISSPCSTRNDMTIVNGHISGQLIPLENTEPYYLLLYAGVAGSTAGNTVRFSNIKLEKGTRATDWSPAPEDMATVAEMNSVINQTAEAITSTVYTKEEIDGKITEVGVQVTQTAGDLRIEFGNSISSAQGTLQDNIDNLAGTTQDKFDDIDSYIRFVDGKVILGKKDNPIILEQSNDRISFKQNGNEVAYISESKLYITDGQFLVSLRIGNFAFIPRSNGSLDFKKVST